MTVATAINRVQAIGDGSTTGFSFPHVFFADADLEVYLTVIATEVSTLQTLTTQYTVSGAGNPSGGTVTFLTAPPSTDRVTIIRVVAQTQGTDYQNASSFDQEVLEKDQDLAIMNIQQMQEELDRAPKQDVGISPVTALAMPKPETGKSIGWDSGGQLVNQSSLPAATFSAGAGDALRPVRVNSAENGLEAHPGLSRPSKEISGTTVLTDSDEHYIVASGLAANINLKLPGTANVKRGDERIVINLDATFSVVIQASNIVVILTLPPSRNVKLYAIQDAPTTPSHWAVSAGYLKDTTFETLDGGSIRTDSGGTAEFLKTKVIEIGDWDMDADNFVTVTHGLTKNKIRSVVVIIIPDNDVTYDVWPTTTSTGTDRLSITDTAIGISRAIGGFFDNTSYDSTSFNRGWITILYAT